MSVLKRKRTGYGLSSALPRLSPTPITSKRKPTSADRAEVGTVWANISDGSYYVKTSSVEGVNFWAPQEIALYSGTGVPTFPAAKGALYSRIDGSSTSTRLYICSVKTGTWVSITTSA